ncbi:MAG: putative Glycosyl transferase, family 2 [Mycobacterium sp.]|nr:putative Glycosyl transferase, family 2 [Mycobacterium sp.]
MTAAPVPAVTVVVPTVDRTVLLGRCLDGLSRQRDLPPRSVQILVVHDGDAGVVRLLAERGIEGLQIAARGVSAKRNAGWRAARAPWVAFTDDDCEPAPGWLAGLLAAAEKEPGADLAAGPVAPHPGDATVTGTFARTVNSEAPGFYPGCNQLVRVAALQRVGGFDERMHGGEDTDLAWRVIETTPGGEPPAWSDDALVWHAVRAVTFGQQLRSLPRWSGLPLVARRHPQLRPLAHRRYFWKRSHTTGALALAGLAGALVDRRALLLAAPHVVRRTREAGPRAGLQLAATDVAEVAVLVAGSVRYRRILL